MTAVDWGGDPKANIAVYPCDTVRVGMEQIDDQIGVSPRLQRLVFGERLLEEEEVWSALGVHQGEELRLTVIVEEVGANKFAPFELGCLLDGYAGATIVGDSLHITAYPIREAFGFLGKQDVELCPGSGEIAYLEVGICGGDSISIGLASHLLIEQAEELNERRIGYSRPWLGYARGSFGWNINGYIHSSLLGVVCACRIPHLRANAGDQLGIMVDCSSKPTIRFFVNGCQVHHFCVAEEGYSQIVFPAFHLQTADFKIISNATQEQLSLPLSLCF